jgi:flagellar basal-body rod modification protein FlgD
MDVKTGTQTWSNAVQKADFKSDGTSNISATDKAKFFQEDSIGDTLNKVADANYVDDSKKMRTVGNNQLNKDAFMSLLLTQMKNQDPTNPLKSHEMAAQLAQFTQLEKLTNIDQSINSLRTDQKPSMNYQALNLIGKAVNTDNSKVTRTDATQNHEIRFNLGASAQQVEVKIKDANGTELRN